MQLVTENTIVNKNAIDSRVMPLVNRLMPSVNRRCKRSTNEIQHNASACQTEVIASHCNGPGLGPSALDVDQARIKRNKQSVTSAWAHTLEACGCAWGGGEDGDEGWDWYGDRDRDTDCFWLFLIADFHFFVSRRDISHSSFVCVSCGRFVTAIREEFKRSGRSLLRISSCEL